MRVEFGRLAVIMAVFLLPSLANAQATYQFTVHQAPTPHVGGSQQTGTTASYSVGDELMSDADVEVENTSSENFFVLVAGFLHEDHNGNHAVDEGDDVVASFISNSGNWKKLEPGESFRVKAGVLKIEYDTSNGDAAEYFTKFIVAISSEEVDDYADSDIGLAFLRKNIYEQGDTGPTGGPSSGNN